jgi:hypothetical protein
MKVKVRRVPSEYHSGIKILAELDNQVANSLIEVLQDLPPATDRQQLATDISEHIDNLDEEIAKEILRVLFSLYDLRVNTELSADELASQICKAAQEDTELSSLSEDQTQNLEARLTLLLGSDGTISASYKAQTVLTDHKHIFASSRVFTDMRPIFKSDTSEEPLAIGIIHTLKVEYRGLDGANEFFVALDSTDLNQIYKEIERAVEKEKTIRVMLDRVDLRCLGEDTD